MTDKRLGKNWKVSDRRKIDKLNYDMYEYTHSENSILSA